jgi:3-oxoacyl-[acyl-carrier protein] reductase
MLGFMRTAALELARFKITINAVLPGNVLTEGVRDLGQSIHRYDDRCDSAEALGQGGGDWAYGGVLRL